MKPYLKISLLFLLAGVLWIVISDQAIFRIFSDPMQITHAQTAKGWLFVLGASGLIYGLARRAYLDQRWQEEERYRVYRKTLEGVRHIFLNYLNQMQLLVIEAEEHPGFDPEVIGIARQVSEEAAAALGRLGEMERVSAEQIDAMIYGGQQSRP
jgi:hypothetical protein